MFSQQMAQALNQLHWMIYMAMSCAAITLDTLQNVVHAAVRPFRQCLDADGGHFEHLHWIQNSRASLISILLLYKYSSYDYRVIFLMSKCVYIILGHPVYLVLCRRFPFLHVFFITFTCSLRIFLIPRTEIFIFHIPKYFHIN